MGRHSRPSEQAPGRLHGNLLRVLGVVAVLAVVVAVWQFTTGFGGEDEVAFTDGVEEPLPTGRATEATSSGGVGASFGVPGTPSASPSPEALPEPSSAAPTEPATSPARADETGTERPTCTASLYVTREWPGNVEVAVVVTNTGSGSISGWEVALDLPEAEIYHAWGLRHDRDDRYDSEHWNSVVEPGEQSGGAFQAEVGDGFTPPETVPCKASD